MKKLFAVLVALTLVLSMGTIALAADTGSITINNAVAGEDYTIYKMFDFVPLAGDATKGRYTAVAAWEGFLTGNEYLELDTDAGTIKWKGAETPERKAELAKAAVAYAKANGIVGTTKEANSTTVEFAGLGLGYYAVDTSLGTICALTTANQAVEVEEKNTQPTVEKKILENGTPVDANNVKIGDTINYQATITAGKGTVNYVLHDTMSKGLTFDGNVTVNVDYLDAGKVDKTLEAGETKDYVFTTDCDDDCTFEIDFTDAFEATLSEGDKIVVTYSATLNSDAEIGNTGNPNEIVLKYGNKQETTKDYVITYTTKLTINKFEIVDNQKKPLTGAGFTLYKDSVADENKIGDELTTGSEFTWTGLEAGTYVLVESTIPDGYNGIDPITFTITWAAPDKVENGDATATWASSEPNVIILQNDGTFKGEIENKTGSLLPSTGGIGTTIFYIVGITLMLGAAIVLISKKRMASFA